MKPPTENELWDFLEDHQKVNALFDRIFPHMKNRHFRAFPVRVQTGYALEIYWYSYSRDQCHPLSHETSLKMKEEWQRQILPHLQETCDVMLGPRMVSIRFFHRKGYINIPP